MTETDAKPPIGRLSVVTPCYNEADGLDAFVARLGAVLADMGMASELVFVNDGSTDDTLAVLHRIAAARSDVAVVNLTRNFGKEVALTAGLAHATGDAVVAIDADLQDPPEVIPRLAARYAEGFDVVYARRTVRHGESLAKRATARAFYRLARDMGPVELPENVGDFRLMSRRAVDALLQLPESHRFMKGLFAWIGYPSAAVDYERDPRHAGTSKWNYGKLMNLSIEGITAFTTAPLRLTTYTGLIVAGFSFLYGVVYLLRFLIWGEEVQGFATLILTILLLGGTQLIALGIIGEYLGRVFNETKRRPLYLVESVHRSPAKDLDAG